MNRFRAWLLSILTDALRPLVEQFVILERRSHMLEVTSSCGHAATREGLLRLAETLASHTRTTSLGADTALTQATGQAELLGDLLLAARGQTEAMRAWEDALLGRVTQAIGDESAATRDAVDRSINRGHADALLASLVPPEVRRAVEEAVASVEADTRLREQRPDLRCKAAVEFVRTKHPDVSVGRAYLAVLLAHGLAGGIV